MRTECTKSNPEKPHMHLKVMCTTRKYTAIKKNKQKKTNTNKCVAPLKQLQGSSGIVGGDDLAGADLCTAVYRCLGSVETPQ